MNIDEAKALMSEESIDNLKRTVTPKPSIDFSNKSNCDIIMQGLCNSINDGTVRAELLEDDVIKILNSSTNTISAPKVAMILKSINSSQPHIRCIITITNINGDVDKQWVFTNKGVNFSNILDYVISEYNITPQTVRMKLSEQLKLTIVNNVAQLVSKFVELTDEEKSKFNVSITTIQRLVNISDHLINCKFVNIKTSGE